MARPRRHFIGQNALLEQGQRGFVPKVAFLRPSLAGLLFVAVLCCSSACAQDQDDAKEQQAFKLAEIASNAQRDEEFRFAAKSWQQLIDDYPESSQIRTAQYNLAKCHYGLKDFASAVLAFEDAVPLMQQANSIELPDALLLLGYSRMQVARQLPKTDPEYDKKFSTEMTTATVHFETILRSFVDFPNANQAAYFQGQAYDELERFKEARASYEKALEFEKDDYQVESMFALGILADRELNPEAAIDWYEKIRAVAAEKGGHPYLSETNYRYGESLMRVGQSLRESNDLAAANEKFKAARDVLAETASDEKFELRDKAMFQQAFCSLLIGEFETAAKQFETVAAIETFDLKDQAMFYAGESWLSANNEEKGRAVLNSVMNSDSSWSVDSALSLSQWLLKSGKPRESFELSDQWVKKAAEHPKEIYLMLVRADASLEDEKLVDRSADLFNEIAVKFPKNPLAPKSLYWSASSHLKAGKTDAAIEQADEFLAKYAGHEFEADVLEVKAESLLMKKQYAASEAEYRNLAGDHSDRNDKLSYWITRAGFAAYLQERYDETIEWLEKKEASITIPEKKAEALYWIGASYFQNEDYDNAKKNLEQSLATNQQWDRTPEVMLALCNVLLKQRNFDDAQKIAESMAEKFANDPEQNVSNAFYAIGDMAIEDGDLTLANASFDTVVDRYPKSETAPYALYRSGVLAMNAKNGDQAQSQFTKFLQQYDGHKLTSDVKLAKTKALRMSGNTEGSIEELKQLLADAKEDSAIKEARYQLGLAYVAAEDWSNAVETFATLTETNGTDNDADKYWYELAWAQREDGKEEESLKSFASLVDSFSNSSFAPEAHFLLGSKSYNDKEYDAAIEHYRKADVDSARGEIREKARYKLGWTYFRLLDFNSAGIQFQNQVADFKEGPLYADGMYMVAQCAFRAKEFDQAFEAYTVAKPVIEQSETVSPRIKVLTLLNGAKSGVETKNFDQAAAMAEALTELGGVDEPTRADAWLQLGLAENGRGNFSEAMTAFKTASQSVTETGARAQAMVGDALFKQAIDAAKSGNKAVSKSKFEEAIEAYNRVYYSYGGPTSGKSVKAWQAYATFETARCNLLQINDAADGDKAALIGQAIKKFETVVNKFPGSKLVPEAKKQLEKLKQLKR